jgi:hypothetical protein
MAPLRWFNTKWGERGCCGRLSHSRGGIPIPMRSFHRFAFLLAFALPAIPVLAQNSSSSSSTPAQDPSQTAGQASSSSQAGQAQQSSSQTQQAASVQERIRQRREQRRATAIHDAYDHRWESYGDFGYLRFLPGPNLQRTTFYAWESGLTRFSSERLGYTLDVRGYYGYVYCGIGSNCQGHFTRPQISQYDALVGPIYRFYIQPKYSISGRVMAGWSYGNFSGDTNGIPPQLLGLYPDGSTFGASASVIGEYNLSPSVAFKLAPEYFFTGFGSTLQASRGFTTGIVYRFGKQ